MEHQLAKLAGTVVPTEDGAVLDAGSTGVHGTAAAAVVTTTRRTWEVAGDRLTVRFWMATPTHPSTFHHLTASLRRA